MASAASRTPSWRCDATASRIDPAAKAIPTIPAPTPATTSAPSGVSPSDQSFVQAGRLWLAAALLIGASLAPYLEAVAADRTNVPLKNWGGFAEYRDSVYDDLERLVTAGLADRVLLNTKPLSRVEAARIVARAIEKIRNDDAGGLNARRDLEPVLDRLMEELKVELTSLGVRTSEGGTAPGFFAFTPIDRAQAFGAYANHQFSLVNSQGP